VESTLKNRHQQFVVDGEAVVLGVVIKIQKEEMLAALETGQATSSNYSAAGGRDKLR
jgi:hypothetical protein